MSNHKNPSEGAAGSATHEYLTLTDAAWLREHVLGVALAEDIADPNWRQPADPDYANKLASALSQSFPTLSREQELGPASGDFMAFCRHVAEQVVALRGALRERIHGRLSDTQLEQHRMWAAYPEYFERPARILLLAHQLAQAVALVQHREGEVV